MKSFKEYILEEKKNSGVIPQPIHFKHVHKKHKKKKVVKESLSLDQADSVVSKWKKEPHPLDTWLNKNDNSHLAHEKDFTYGDTGGQDHEKRHQAIREKLTQNVNLDDDHKQAIHAYTDGSQGMNHALMEIHHDLENNTYRDDSNDEKNGVHHIETLDDAIHSNPAPHDYHAYSGLGFDPRDHIKNSRLYSPSFISATTNKSVANQFANTNRKTNELEDKHIMHLHIKKGDPALHLPETEGTHPHEFETIIASDRHLKHLGTKTLNPNDSRKIHIHHFEIER